MIDPLSRYESHTITVEVENANRTYPYRLLKPTEPDKSAPLVVFLHGAGERGDDNLAQLTYLPTWALSAGHLQDKACYLLAVQCPADEQWAPYEVSNEPLGDASPSLQAVIAAMQQVINRENVDLSRIYLTGLSMGGYGSWDLAARHPRWFAAVVPICGGGRLETASQLVDVPIWAFHGTNDTVVQEAESRMMIEAIRAAGGRPAYSPLPDVGHGSWHFAYGPRGAIEWMFGQENPTPPALNKADPGHAAD